MNHSSHPNERVKGFLEIHVDIFGEGILDFLERRVSQEGSGKQMLDV